MAKSYIYEMPPLDIYKASAGSGKTFALTLEYLVLLFRNPEAYRHILAVTFTNKAAGEMKERILGRLHKMAHDPEGEGKKDIGLLQKATGKSRDALVKGSALLLKAILNDYSSFSVGTIDRFFQSVIRAFTREIGIQPAYNLELDNKRILGLGVERLFADIDGDMDLQRWLIRYAEERMEQSLGWNFQEDVIQLGMELFNEAFQELFAAYGMHVLEREVLRVFQEKLVSLEKTGGKRIMEHGKKAMELMSGAGLEPDDFKRKSQSPAQMFRQAMEEGSVNFTDSRLRSMEDGSRWLNAGSGAAEEQLLSKDLLPLLAEIHREQVMINSIAAIRGHFYTLGILGDLQNRVQAYLKENNLFLISDSGRFLRGIIGGNQVPFVYERTGNRYRHIMLDEFQDTSVFQYDNFRPLLDNALASGNENLLVGDVKQSIYRWRNSDWRILAEQVEGDFSHQGVSIEALKQNFRSSEQIIRFNNSVFQLAADRLAVEIAADQESARSSREAAREAEDRFRKAYADAVQELAPSTLPGKGAVRMEFFSEEEGRTFHEAVLEVLPGWILELQEHGVEPGEIAILVRTGREGIKVARVLLDFAQRTGRQEAFRLVSNDSLLLEQNETVVLLLAAMNYLARPDDHVNAAQLKLRYVSISGQRDLSSSMNNEIGPPEVLPKAFRDGQEELARMPLYEMVERLVEIFSLNEREEDLPFIRGFQEEVLDASRRDTPDLPAFLELWKQKGSNRAIQLSEASNAIRIMTIHRAKGLEFKAVLIPFCSWEITTDARKSNILWCATEGTPFNDLPLVPLRFSKDLKQTHFAPYYYQERMKGYLDNLNLMYVAFTRAKEILYIGLPEKKEKKKNSEELKSTAELIHSIMDKNPDLEPCLHALSDYMEEGICRIGELPALIPEEEKKEESEFRLRERGSSNAFPALLMRKEDWLKDGEESGNDSRLFGNMMHLLFARITYAKDLPGVLRDMQEEGLVSLAEKEELAVRVGTMLVKQEVREWFLEKEGRKVHNERSIFTGEGSLLRPDRIIVDPEVAQVIDFKFGHLQSGSHRRQVQAYRELMLDMGFPEVEAWLWYVSLGIVEKVEGS